MKVKLLVTITLIMFLLGCQRGDIKISPVIEGQTATHAGYNIGPELYLEAGDKAKVTGAVVWINGLDPNDLLE